MAKELVETVKSIFTPALGIIAAAISVTAPLVTGVMEMGKIYLAEAHDRSALQVQFFDKAIDSARPSPVRLSVLHFLSTSKRVDPDVREWAAREIPMLTQLIEKESVSTAALLAAEVERANLLKKEPAATDLSGAARSRERLAASEARVQELARDDLALKQIVATTKQAAGEPCTRAEMRDDLRSGINEAEGTMRCQKGASSHTRHELWIERWNGLAFQCECL